MVSVPAASDDYPDTKYTESDVLLSRHFNLTPAEIQKWSQIKTNSSLHGFVHHQNMSVYEILALHVEDEQQLRRLARLFAEHSLQIIKKLERFDSIYQEEARKIQ